MQLLSYVCIYSVQHQIGLSDFCQQYFSASTKVLNFKLCSRKACSGRSMHIYFFVNFRFFQKKYEKNDFSINTISRLISDLVVHVVGLSVPATVEQ